MTASPEDSNAQDPEESYKSERQAAVLNHRQRQDVVAQTQTESSRPLSLKPAKSI